MTISADLLARLDDGLPLADADRAVLAVFERHAQADWSRFELRPEPLPTDRCACGGVKEPGWHECHTCFLDWDDRMRRAADD